MKKVPLTQGKYALVDDSDFEALTRHDWHVSKQSKGRFYALRSVANGKGKQKAIRMHREIMQTPEDMETDHVDGNGLNNQRSNLRVCTKAENNRNVSKRRDNTSGFKGVSFEKSSKRWAANIMSNGKQIKIGRFPTKESAYAAYCEACVKYHGAFSRLK